MNKCSNYSCGSNYQINRNFFNDIIFLISLMDNHAFGCDCSFRNNVDIMQYIGLRDYSGHVIHFGDILIDSSNNLLTPVIEVSNNEHTLFFKPIQHLNKSISIGCKSTYSHTLKIVGDLWNIRLLIEKIEKGTLFVNDEDMQILYSLLNFC